jgi:hypothetical protein
MSQSNASVQEQLVQTVIPWQWPQYQQRSVSDFEGLDVVSELAPRGPFDCATDKFNSTSFEKGVSIELEE